MTEPKVVHEWGDGAFRFWVHDGMMSWEGWEDDRTHQGGTVVCPHSAIEELARLADMVKALLDARQADCENIQRHMAENERLRDRVEELEDVCGSRGMKIVDLVNENKRLRDGVKELDAALDQYREDADEWKCPTCGEWQREWQMYCDKPECRPKEK